MGRPNRLINPAESAWLYTSSSSKVAISRHTGSRGGDARVDDVALIELQLHVAGDGLLGGVHKGGQGLAQRGVPLAVVHQVGELQGHLLLVVIGLLIQAELLQLVVGVVEDGAAGVS